jgi:hypothetical protein
MSLQLQNEAARRLARRSSHRGPAASALFGRSVRLLDAAEDLTRVTPRRVNRDAFVSAVGSMSAALEALATAVLELSLTARRASEDGANAPEGEISEGEHATRLLYAASQNLRMAAEATKLAQRSLAPTARAAPARA